MMSILKTNNSTTSNSRGCGDGLNVALVIRDSSPLDWAWDATTDKIAELLNVERNPFDKGIWLISYSKDRIYKFL